MEMKVTKKKVDQFETEITVTTEDNSLNWLSIRWDGRSITVQQNCKGIIKVFVNGARCSIHTDIVEVYKEIKGGTVTLTELEE